LTERTFSVVDVETTGLVPRYDRVTEIAVVQVRGGKIVHTYSSLINPQRPIPDGIQRMTGITDELVRKAPLFSDVHQHLHALISGTVLVAHHAQFDYGFLQAEFARCGSGIEVLSLVDTVRLARKNVKGLASYRLSTLCAHLGIAPGGHRALGDATATAHLLIQLGGELMQPALKRERSRCSAAKSSSDARR